MRMGVIGVVVAGVVALAVPGRADFSNGDFSSGLTDWTSQGDVVAVSETAALGDNNATVSAIYQPVAWPVGSFTLEFDFREDISGSMPQGSFPDTAFASLYFADDPQTFDPNSPGSFNSAVGLFEIDTSGQYVLNGTVTPGIQGGDWYHYAITLENTSGYLIPYIELHDQNFITNDSRLYVDNFSVVVPEPATLALFGTGGLLMLARARRARHLARNGA